MIDDGMVEAAGEASVFIATHSAGLVVDVVNALVFSGTLPRFFHGVGRRAIAVVTLGSKRIPSSLRLVPRGMRPRARSSDWLALWIGLLLWVALFAGGVVIAWKWLLG